MFLPSDKSLGTSMLARVCAFGPISRVDNCITTRLLDEVWMIEPEMAFTTLEDDMGNGISTERCHCRPGTLCVGS
jgi:aspartyl/asparaginyl-tRNA synthetase